MNHDTPALKVSTQVSEVNTLALIHALKQERLAVSSLIYFTPGFFLFSGCVIVLPPLPLLRLIHTPKTAPFTQLNCLNINIIMFYKHALISPGPCSLCVLV